MKSDYNSIDAYIADFPSEIQVRLQQMRSIIQRTAPGATEAISYGMPTFKLQGNLVHFAAHKNHIGFYPFPSIIETYKDQLAGYHTSKGTIQFPHNQPLPEQLIELLVKARIDENHQKAILKASKKLK